MALAVRAGVGQWMLATGRHRLPDSELYVAYAETIAEGREYALGKHGAAIAAKRTPGYPAFVAAAWAVGGRGDAAVVRLQWLLGTLTAALVGLFGHLLHRSAPAVVPAGTGWWSALLVALAPYAVVMDGYLLTESLFSTLLAATLCVGWSAAEARDMRRRWLLVGAGALAGAAVMVRPSVLLACPLLPLLGRRSGDRPPRLLADAGCVLLGFVLACGPWWGRNAFRYHTFVPTALNGGESLYDGLGPQATGASDMRFAEPWSMGERAEDRMWRRKALAAAAAEPARIVRLAWVKLGRFWSPWPNAAQFRTPAVMALTTAATVPAWALMLAGLARLGREGRWRIALACTAVVVYFTALHTVFVASVRYREPALLPAYPLAGMVLAGWWRRWRQAA